MLLLTLSGGCLVEYRVGHTDETGTESGSSSASDDVTDTGTETQTDDNSNETPSSDETTSDSSSDSNDSGNACPGKFKTLCGTDCVDTRRDPQHCGACFVACASDVECIDGECLPTCELGCDLSIEECDASKRCACLDDKTHCGDQCFDFSSDPANCGACNIVCDSGQSCQLGMCS